MSELCCMSGNVPVFLGFLAPSHIQILCRNLMFSIQEKGWIKKKEKRKGFI